MYLSFFVYQLSRSGSTYFEAEYVWAVNHDYHNIAKDWALAKVLGKMLAASVFTYSSYIYGGFIEKEPQVNNSELIISNITGKIKGQMSGRGWTEDSINSTVNNSYTARGALNKATGNSATAYYNFDGSYVVRDNITGDIVQISLVGDVNWVPDSTIINPYFPNK